MTATSGANKLLEKLQAIRSRDGLSHRKFAKRIGISRALWQKTLNGERRVGRAIIEGVLRTYPELKEDALAVFSDVSTEADESHQNGFLGRFRAWCSGLLRFINWRG